MKIAVIGSKGLPPKQGGIEHHCAEIYPRIVAEGHHVDLYARTSYTQMSWKETYDYEGVRVVNVPSLPLRGLDALLTSALAAIVASSKKYDVIHFHALGPSLFSWIPRLLSPRTKVVATCHGLDWQRAKWGKLSSFLIRSGERMAMQCAHEVVVVAEALQPYFQKTYNRHVPYISNGPAHYQASDPNYEFARSMGLMPGKYILFLGRLVPEKCPDVLIRAFQALRPAGWKLAVVGGNSDTSSYTSELMALASDDPDIVFTGELRGQQLAEVVRGAGLFTLPSLIEGLPLALLEAMNENVPVLTSDIPVHQLLVGSDRGQIFRVNDIPHCIQQLQWCIENPDIMAHRAQHAKRYIDIHHSWDKIAATLFELYSHQVGEDVEDFKVPATSTGLRSKAASLLNIVGNSPR